LLLNCSLNPYDQTGFPAVPYLVIRANREDRVRTYDSTQLERFRRNVGIGALTVIVLGVITLAVLMRGGSVASAAAQYGPPNTAPPSISGTPQEGQTLTASPGTWAGSGLTFAYQWQRCGVNGGSCADISNATGSAYKLQGVDVGNTLRVRVTATDSTGAAASASSAPTAVITATPKPPATGCPTGTGTAPIAQVTTPARLNVDRFAFSPSPVGAATTAIRATFHVSDTCNQSVSGALVYVTAVPFNQFSIPPEQQTDANGNVTVQMNRLSGFPAARRQKLLALFVRARKNGEPLLGGISTRRLVSTHVDLSR
jgi:hypothetical protein